MCLGRRSPLVLALAALAACGAPSSSRAPEARGPEAGAPPGRPLAAAGAPASRPLAAAGAPAGRPLAAAGAPASRPLAAAGAPASRPLAATAPAVEPGGVTFFVTADTHVGDLLVADATPAMIDAMNRLPGTPLPAPLVGRVAAPRGVLVAGDLTDRGTAPQWQAFVAAFGLTGRDGRLRFPVFEGTGNHDLFGGRTAVARGVARRHRALVYALDWDDVHVVCLDRYPTAGHRRWLARDLARQRPGRPVILYFHYPLAGPYSNPWSEADKAALAAVIKPYRVAAIFHGHYHPERRYEWEGIPVFDVGSPYWDPTFAVGRVTATHLEEASFDYVAQRFTAVFRGELPAAPGRRAGSPAASGVVAHTPRDVYDRVYVAPDPDQHRARRGAR